MTQSTTSANIPTLLEQAEEAREAGDYDQGVALAREAADRAAGEGDHRGQASALRLEANSLIRLGEYERAAEACDLAISLLEALGDEAGICQALSFQGQAYSFLGLQEEALTALGAGLEVAHRLGDSSLLFWTSNRIGVVHCDLADWAQAEPFLHHAHELSVRSDLGKEAAFCILNNLAMHAVGYVKELRDRGDQEPAEERLRAGLAYARQAVDAARAAAHPYREAISLGNLSVLLGLAGDYDAGAAQSARSKEISLAHGYRPLELDALRNTAELMLWRGDLAAATEGFTQVLDRAKRMNETQVVLDAHEQLSAAYELVGDCAAALRHFREYHRIERTAHSEVANRRAKLLTQRFELHNARLEADNARLEARLALLRSHQLEAEKLALEVRANELGRHANEDPLTGLWNRRHMDDRCPELFRRAVETGRPLCATIGDVDRFKSINDRFGHATGDQVLRQLAAVLRGGCRPGDMLARMGGDEFFLAFIDTGFTAARATCERLRRGVESYVWEAIAPGLAVTISFGLGEAAGVADYHQLLARADRSLYAAKWSGRNRVEPGSPPR
ncbi:MAG: GGDEF domain-containing protein [Actinomycetota bacterium]|nr:GGDEF domain-containing protein [Actinomycetota bacterium]